jgi:hypothetical protein
MLNKILGSRSSRRFLVVAEVCLWFSQFRVLVFDEPGHNGKQKAGGESAHQHTCNALYRAHRSPHLFEKNIACRADRRITGRRKVESRFPVWKTSPAIKPSPQQNLQHVQADKQTGESHHEHGGTEKAEMANAFGKLSFYPLDESGHARALQYKRERYENDRCPGLVDENHKVLVQRLPPDCSLTRDNTCD